MSHSLKVTEAATLFQRSRATIYRDIKNGDLSAKTVSEGGRDKVLIDVSELIRRYGEPPSETSSDVSKGPDSTAVLQERVAARDREIELLREALEREKTRADRVEALLTDQRQVIEEALKPRKPWWQVWTTPNRG